MQREPPPPDITVIVVNYNTGHLLARLFSALEAASGDLILQVIIVDNASTDDSLGILRTQYPEIHVIENRINVGFGRANNQAVAAVRGRYVLLLNTDAFLSEDTLRRTIAFIEQNPECGVLGVKLVGEDGSLQPSCRYFPTPWNVFLASTGLSRLFKSTRLIDDMTWDHASVRECDWVPGCYYLMPRQVVVDSVGLFDPRFFLYYEEVDHCWSAKAAGWSVIFFPFTSVIHIGGESAKSEGSISTRSRQLPLLQIESQLLFFRKRYGLTGVLQSLLLTGCEVALALFKDLTGRRGFARTMGAYQNLQASLAIFLKTRFATTPTR